MNKKLKIGLFGFGCVGQGFYDIFSKSQPENAEISYICVQDHQKKRSLPADSFIFDENLILNDPEIDLVIEVISEADEAFDIVKSALLSGKKVISANKKMIAEHLSELIDLQTRGNGTLLYESSSCGSIPIIRTLEDYFAFEPINKIKGIFNGSSNFILSKINEEGLSYEQALKEAQDLGFAEADPTLDVGGFDALNKLCIVLYHAFGTYVHPNEVLNLGIHNLHADDNLFATEKQWKLKQIAFAATDASESLQAFVLPQFVEENEDLFHIDQEYNAVNIEAAFAGNQLLKGKGAGSHPTGAAVFSDFKAINAGYVYGYPKKRQNLKLNNDIALKIYVSSKEEDQLKAINFGTITEKGKVGKVFYQIGEISLSFLLANKQALAASQVFIAALPERVQSFSGCLRLEEVVV